MIAEMDRAITRLRFTYKLFKPEMYSDKATQLVIIRVHVTKSRTDTGRWDSMRQLPGYTAS